MSLFSKTQEATDFIRCKLPALLQSPGIAIICGSGLGGLADTLEKESRVDIAYDAIPHFVPSTVLGHAGHLAFGLLGPKNVPTACMIGRVHFYEGYDMQQVTFPIRVFSMLGIQTLIVTNAAGGLNEGYGVGDIMLLSDHINIAGLAGMHPLRGPNSDEFGLRFLALSDAYDEGLRQAVYRAAEQTKIKRKIHEGTYAFVAGPSYETKAEARLLKTVGADTVGMSTVPEIIVARHCGMRILAMSLVTNMVVLGDASLGKADHEDVLRIGRLAALDMQLLVDTVVVNM